jgi:hypothetical protein
MWIKLFFEALLFVLGCALTKRYQLSDRLPEFLSEKLTVNLLACLLASHDKKSNSVVSKERCRIVTNHSVAA